VGDRPRRISSSLLGVPLQPLRAGHEAFHAQHFAEARQARQGLFEAWRDEGTGALDALDQALFEQNFQGLARGDPGDVQGFAEGALRGQGLVGGPLAGVDGLLQVACQLQVERSGAGVVGAQGG